MALRVRLVTAILIPLIILLTAAPSEAVNKCLVWVWIDGWRCAIGI